MPAQYCAVGSIKSNIGHLELAAGVTGMIKVLLQMRHRTLVKSLHCEEINPYIALSDSPFYIVQKAQTWEAFKDDRGIALPRRAGVSSFGFGGTNAHVVMEEYIAPERPVTAFNGQVLILLSARSEDRLMVQVTQLLSHLKTHDVNLIDLAYTLQVGREALEVRCAFVVDTVEGLKDRLSRYIKGATTLAHTYHGAGKREQDTLALFHADEALQEAIGKWIAGGKISKLAALWVLGMEVSWEQLYGSDICLTKPRRLSLPTYPFMQERCWIPTPVALQTVAVAQPMRADPMLTEAIVSAPAPALLACADTLQVRIESEVTALVAKHVGIAQEELALDIPVSEFGFDSVMLLPFLNALNQLYQLDIEPTVFFDYQTIAALAGYLTQELTPTLQVSAPADVSLILNASA
ncbi:KS-MAT linker domain-containing protein [Glaciimonas sp. GG7]